MLAELDTTDLHNEADQLFARVAAAAEAIDELMARNACDTHDQTECQRRFDRLDADHIEFTSYLWHTLIDHTEVYVDTTITFTFRDGRKKAIPLKK